MIECGAARQLRCRMFAKCGKCTRIFTLPEQACCMVKAIGRISDRQVFLRSPHTTVMGYGCVAFAL